MKYEQIEKIKIDNEEDEFDDELEETYLVYDKINKCWRECGIDEL